MMIADCTVVTCWERKRAFFSNGLMENSDQMKHSSLGFGE